MSSNLAYDFTATGGSTHQESVQPIMASSLLLIDEASSSQGIYLAADNTSTGKAQITRKHTTKRAMDFFEKTDLGEGGYALAPSSQAKQAIKDILRRKFHR